MKQKFLLISLVIFLYACGKSSKTNSSGNFMLNKKEANVSDLKVKDYVSLDTSSTKNTIVLAKICTESSKYKFMYQLENGMWIASNEAWYVGSRIKFQHFNNDSK